MMTWWVAGRALAAWLLDVGHLWGVWSARRRHVLPDGRVQVLHKLVRHRHLSYSQLSRALRPRGQRGHREPDLIADDPELHRLFSAAAQASREAYG